MGIADEKYVAFTTFRRTGEAVTTPVWIAPLGPGRAGFSTGASSGKAKRLAHTPRVVLQPCSQRGQIVEDSQAVTAQARIVRPGESEFDSVMAAIQAKYRWAAAAIAVAGKVADTVRRSKTGMAPDAAVVIDLSEQSCLYPYPHVLGCRYCAQMSLSEEKYIAFTTFRRTGEAVTSPVWLAPLSDGTYGFWTSSGSGKAKRLGPHVPRHGATERCSRPADSRH